MRRTSSGRWLHVPSFSEIVRALNRGRVRYVLVGGYASVVHGVPRTTVDIDIAVDPDPANVRRTVRALRRSGLEPETDRADEILGQGGVTAMNDRTVDVLTSLRGAKFADVWSRKIVVVFEGVRVFVVARRDQIRLLYATGRPQDLEDAAVLASKERMGR